MYLTLVLSFTYEPMYFVSERKAIKLIATNKAEILSHWEGNRFLFGEKIIWQPATLRFRYLNKHVPKKPKFNRKLILKRDLYKCAYCGYAGTPNNMTIDHILPKCQGGRDTFENCVSACKACNGYKNDKTPEQAKMPLLWLPTLPESPLLAEFNVLKYQHPDWHFYMSRLIK